MVCRRGEDRYVPTTLPPRAADHRQGGCRQQLRPRPLHHRQGDRGHRAGPGAQAERPVHRAPGLSRVPQLRRRHRLRLHVAAHGTPLRGLRQEEQARVLHLPCPTGE